MKLSLNRKLGPEETSFIQATHAVFLREKELSYEEVVREYRRVEAEFVEADKDEAWKVLETKRRITEWLLMYADRAEQPFSVCRAFWEELVERGFSSIEMKCNMSGVFARICQEHAEFDEGIAVLNPCIAELDGFLSDPNLPATARSYCVHERKSLASIRAALEARIQSPPPPDAESSEPDGKPT